MALKTSVLNLCKSQFSVYSDEDGKTSTLDIIIFLLLPFAFGITYLFVVKDGNEALRYIYGSIAFLSGFIFSAFIVVMNLAAIISGNIQGRASNAAKKTIKEVAVISLFVFTCGVTILTLGVLDMLISSLEWKFSYYLAKLVQALAIVLTTNVILNLFMVAKKLHSVIDDVLSIEN